jgi:hypothetical protein
MTVRDGHCDCSPQATKKKKTSYATEHSYNHSRSRHYMEDTGQFHPSAFSISASLHNNRFYSDELRCRFTGYHTNSDHYKHFYGARGGVVVKALRYKPAGRGFDSRWCHNPSGRTMTLGSTQPLNRNEYQVYFRGVKAAGA